MPAFAHVAIGKNECTHGARSLRSQHTVHNGEVRDVYVKDPGCVPRRQDLKARKPRRYAFATKNFTSHT
jgi:hypothetical protein